MKLNAHGVIGTLAILGMLTNAAIKHWNINWIYFGIAITVYAIVVIAITAKESEKHYSFLLFILGCHVSLILLALGLLIEVSSLLETIIIFGICVFLGLSIPRLLLWKQNGKLGINIHGLPGILLLFVALSVAFSIGRTSWVYLAVTIILYCFPILFGGLLALQSDEQQSYAEDMPLKPSEIRLIWGWHLVLVFLIGGMLIPAENMSQPIWLTYLIIFVASIAAGLAIPVLLLKVEE